MTLLEVRDLSVAFGRRPPAIHDIGFTIEPGERLGLIGESGSGKTVTSLAVMGLLPANARVRGSITLDGMELVGASDKVLSTLRGDRISMIFQEPMSALDPTMRCGRQIAEAIRLHGGADAGHARERVLELLSEVGFSKLERVADSYPHQLSGGQRQRVVIAMALANGPDLVICDEPTTALDVTVQARVLSLLDSVLTAHNAACLFITHDLAVVSQIANSIIVMRDGAIVEAGSAASVLGDPQHPYTRGLLATARLDLVEPGSRLPTVEDMMEGR